MYTVLYKDATKITLQHIYSKILVFWDLETNDLLFSKDNMVYQVKNSWNPQFEIPAYVEYLNICLKEWNS